MKIKKTLLIKIVGVFALLSVCVIWFFFASKSDYVLIPITYRSSNTPLIDVEISGKVYSIELDLGSRSLLTIDRSVLSQLDKRAYGSTYWMDLKGNAYESSRFLIPQIIIGGITFREVLVEELDENFFYKTSQQSDLNALSIPVGLLGRPLLERTNLCIDFQKSIIMPCSSMAQLKKAGYFLEKFIRIPFQLTRAGIVLQIETDIGNKRLVLDTGCTLTLIRSSLLEGQKCRESESGQIAFSSSRFEISGKNFGSKDLYRFDLAEEIDEIDGVLGMDFLKNRIIYIDYPSKILYISQN